MVWRFIAGSGKINDGSSSPVMRRWTGVQESDGDLYFLGVRRWETIRWEDGQDIHLQVEGHGWNDVRVRERKEEKTESTYSPLLNALLLARYPLLLDEGCL